MSKPIRIMTGGLTNAIYAVKSYRDLGGGRFEAISKQDVTREAIQAVDEHRSRCQVKDCPCRPSPT